MAATAAVPAQRCLLALLIITLSMLLPMSASAQSSSTANYTVPNVVQALNASGNFSIFLSIAAKANITSALQAFISSANTSGATAFVPLDSAFTPEIVSAYASLSTANQANLLLYHVLPRYYNRSQVVTLSNVATLAAVLNNSTTGYRLSAVNQSSSNDGVITVYASVNAANVSSANISGIPHPPSFPIAIYPIRSVLLPVDIFGSVPDVVQVLNVSGNFSTFLSIAGKANITSALQAFIGSGNTSGATAFVPLDSAFTPEIVSAYANLSAANQANLLLYHVLPRYYNRSQLVALSNVATLAAVLNNSTTGYRLSAVNQSGSNDGVITVYASVNAANVSSANISGIPNPPSFPIAIYPIRSVLLPVEIFGSTSNSSSPSPSPSPSSSAGPSSSKSPSPTPSPSTSNKSAPSPSPSAAAPISSSSSSFHYLISMTTLLLMFAISNLF